MKHADAELQPCPECAKHAPPPGEPATLLPRALCLLRQWARGEDSPLADETRRFLLDGK